MVRSTIQNPACASIQSEHPVKPRWPTARRDSVEPAALFESFAESSGSSCPILTPSEVSHSLTPVSP